MICGKPHYTVTAQCSVFSEGEKYNIVVVKLNFRERRFSTRAK